MTTPSAGASEAFFEAVENRRTYYSLSPESPLSNDQLRALVSRAVKHAPNAFNMQQCRALIVTGQHHHKLWDMVTETSVKVLGKTVEEEKFWKNKIDTAYRPGYGTILFFEDQDVIKQWSTNMPPMAPVFPIWSENAAGILQYIVWTALEKEGLGASLQHFSAYNPETQARVTEMFGVPASWKNSAMMPFGAIAGPPGNPDHPKVFAALEDRVKTIFDTSA